MAEIYDGELMPFDPTLVDNLDDVPHIRSDLVNKLLTNLRYENKTKTKKLGEKRWATNCEAELL